MRQKLFMVLSILALNIQAADNPPPAHSDHTVYTRIVSEPVGVNIYAMSEAGQPPELLGTTPFTLVSELTWPRTILGLQWEGLSIWSPGNTCTSSYEPTNKTHTLTVHVLAAKPGYQPISLHRDILILPKKGFDAERYKDRPSEKRIELSLEPLNMEPTRADEEALSPTTVVLATGSGEGRSTVGRVTIESERPHADIRIDGQLVATTPATLVMWTGTYDLAVEQEGQTLLKQQIQVGAKALHIFAEE